MMDANLHAVVTILAAVIGIWAVGRVGPMTSRTRPGDIVAIICLAIGALGLSAFSLLAAMPPFELLTIFFGGLTWWLLAAPTTYRTKYSKPKLRKRGR